MVPTGLAVSIPQDHELQIRPRSGLAAKKSITVLNTPGTIDSDYRGEIKIILINLGKKNFEITSGLRIAQMVLCPISKAELSEVDDLDKTSRDHGGFGSTTESLHSFTMVATLLPNFVLISLRVFTPP